MAATGSADRADRAQRASRRSAVQPADYLEDMAAAAGISKFHFAREFKARTGISPVAFLRGYRVVRAMDNLLSSNERISDVAAAAGYQNAAAFSRASHKFTGHALPVPHDASHPR